MTLTITIVYYRDSFQITKVYDLPTGAPRWDQKCEGYVYTIKSGQVTFEAGVSTGVLPGQLVRNPVAKKRASLPPCPPEFVDYRRALMAADTGMNAAVSTEASFATLCLLSSVSWLWFAHSLAVSSCTPNAAIILSATAAAATAAVAAAVAATAVLRVDIAGTTRSLTRGRGRDLAPKSRLTGDGRARAAVRTRRGGESKTLSLDGHGSPPL